MAISRNIDRESGTEDSTADEPPQESRPDPGDPPEPDPDAQLLPTGFADVVVGGQAGSEGKGAVVGHLLRTCSYGASVRPGSSNAGHTVYHDTEKGQALASEVPDDERWEEYVHQVIPSAITVSPNVVCYMAPESSFGLDEFFEEMQDARDRWGDANAAARVVVDPKAAIITEEHRATEADRKLGEDIGSTVHGCGAVRVEKTWRSAGDVRLAGDYAPLSSFLSDNTASPVDGHNEASRVPEMLVRHGRRGEQVLVEGTQGTLLSMNQGPHWPYSTSRDCIASTMLSSCGLPPSAAGDVWAVFRTYPIRVGGDSGPMAGEEIDFGTIADRAGHTDPPVEFTSVTDKKRRIFEWSWDQFHFALRLNDPDWVAVTFLDYLNADDFAAETWEGLSHESRQFLRDVDEDARKYNGARVGLAKTGPLPDHAIDFRPDTGGGPDGVPGDD